MNESHAGIPQQFRAAAAMLSGDLAALMHAELDAGNTMIDAGHTHPAPPAGAYVMFANRISSRERASFGNVRFYDRNGASYSGEFADANRFFFVLEAPHQDDAYPDMNAIREQANQSNVTEESIRAIGDEKLREQFGKRSAAARFEESRELDYERWKEGTSYDLEALRAMSAAEQDLIAVSMIPPRDWRDVEALATIGSPRSDRALRDAVQSGSAKLRLAVLRHAPHLVDAWSKLETMLNAVDTAESFEGLVETLDMLETYHPPELVDALFHKLLDRSGEIAYSFATALAVIHGKLPNRYDWSLRPQLLKFNTNDRREREDAFLALYDMLRSTRAFRSGAATTLAEKIRTGRAQ